MDHGQLSMVADKFQWVFSEALLNACGKDAKFCRRERIITPFRLGLALTATCASQRVETLADFHRGFHALFQTTITYKAFYNQGAKPHCAAFIRTMTSRLIGEMTLKVLGFEKGRAFTEFRQIIIQDGSSFAIHDALREVFPGRFNPTASFNSLSNVPVLKGVVTSRSWLTSDTLRWSWDPTSSVSSGAGTFGGETEV
jgi:hypothetical protein